MELRAKNALLSCIEVVSQERYASVVGWVMEVFIMALWNWYYVAM